jgi:hypothetical protein
VGRQVAAFRVRNASNEKVDQNNSNGFETVQMVSTLFKVAFKCFKNILKL